MQYAARACCSIREYASSVGILIRRNHHNRNHHRTKCFETNYPCSIFLRLACLVCVCVCVLRGVRTRVSGAERGGARRSAAGGGEEKRYKFYLLAPG